MSAQPDADRSTEASTPLWTRYPEGSILRQPCVMTEADRDHVRQMHTQAQYPTR